MPASRRALLASLLGPALASCAAPLPPLDSATAPGAQALLTESAAAHGSAAFAGMADISVSYAGEWGGVVDRLQPELVDAGFRGGSQERLLLQGRMVAQAHAGPRGRKQVVRRTPAGQQGDVRVWFNGEDTTGTDRRSTNLRGGAALVADAYSLFLLGPLVLARHWAADRALAMALAGTGRVRVEGTDHECDVLRVRVVPGLGLSEGDDLALYIDRTARLMRRVRITLNGMEGTRGALAEVDASGHVLHAGVRWPTRFAERLLRPLPLHVHDWRLTGLDVNRGMTPADVGGPEFTGRAAAAAHSPSPSPSGRGSG